MRVLDTDEISIARLLAPLLDQRLAITGVAEAALSGRQSVWPDEPFSAGAFDAFTGNIHLDCRRLVLSDGIALDGAKLAIALGGGSIDIEDISGKGLGGQLKAKLQLSKAAAGADLRGTLNFGAALEALSGGTPPRASGPRQRHAGIRGSRLESACTDADPARAGQDRLRRGQARHLVAGRHPAGGRCRHQGRARQAGGSASGAAWLPACRLEIFRSDRNDLRWNSPTASCASKSFAIDTRRRPSHRRCQSGSQGADVRFSMAARSQGRE